MPKKKERKLKRQKDNCWRLNKELKKKLKTVNLKPEQNMIEIKQQKQQLRSLDWSWRQLNKNDRDKRRKMKEFGKKRRQLKL